MELSAGWRYLLCHSAPGRQLPSTIQRQVHSAASAPAGKGDTEGAGAAPMEDSKYHAQKARLRPEDFSLRFVH